MRRMKGAYKGGANPEMVFYSQPFVNQSENAAGRKGI